ncbi:MAG: glycosyltransferase [Fusobacterium perfoetens]|uniref:glycosyltransferase family 2 protein n=1 Tax=Fusobacterium perfoetens TaxID=852 RepID=UPI0023F25F46|nr:glycosyltransferase [Fusobacterium perfoetens]MCI6152860.1 glycosyltransferase [Fusobacterium perfoetens]MDY3237272.1 glycosyltransferase [Fusobacterium perfoetens]
MGRELSIIIPVYNKEKYIKKCLDSIKYISNIDYEILVINDGSTDNSQKEIEKISKENKKVKVFEKKNGGAGSARNLGLLNAEGRYIWFVDSDDLIVAEEFEQFFKNVKINNLDIGFGNYNIFYNEDEIIKKEINKEKRLEKIPIIDGKRYFSITEKYKLSNMIVCKNIYKREFLLKEKILWPENMIFEDEVFYYLTLNRAQRVKYIDNDIYLYRQNVENSVMTKSEEKIKDYFKVAYFLGKEVITHKTNRKMKNIPFKFYIRALKKIKIRDYEIEKTLFKIHGLYFEKIRRKIEILYYGRN